MPQEHVDRSPRYFGSDAQQRMQRIAHLLWPLLKANPVYGYEGRMVGIDDPQPQDIDAVAALTRIQGASVSHYVPLDKEAELSAAFVDRGLATDRWDQFMGGSTCLSMCEDFVRNYQVPAGYTLRTVDTSTSDQVFGGLSDTALSCGVLPHVSAVLTGQSQNAVCYLFEAPDGGIAACASAVMRNHPDSRFATASWWGMLATREADRGRALSLYLGARAALHMYDKFGATSFYTGVRKDNIASRHVCQKLGVVESDYACLAILDPEFFGDGGYTK